MFWVADGANAIWYAAEGNYADAAISGAGMIPGGGNVATAARITKKTADAIDAAGDTTKTVDNATDTARAPDSSSTSTTRSGDGGGSSPTRADGCPTNSFVPGTHVVMADGTTKAIEDLETGDMVWATDPETGDTRAREVTDTRDHKSLRHMVTLTIDTDGDKGDKTSEITSTDEHPYWLPAAAPLSG